MLQLKVLNHKVNFSQVTLVSSHYLRQNFFIALVPVLPDVVAQLGEDDSKKDNLEDDKDGHVVHSSIDGAHRVVVEGHEVRALKFLIDVVVANYLLNAAVGY